MPKTPEPAILQKIKYEELREALISTKSTAERVCDSPQRANLASQFVQLDKFFEGWRAISVEPDAIRGKGRAFSNERFSASCEPNCLNYMRTPVTLALFSGMRRGEISRLRWQ